MAGPFKEGDLAPLAVARSASYTAETPPPPPLQISSDDTAAAAPQAEQQSADTSGPPTPSSSAAADSVRSWILEISQKKATGAASHEAASPSATDEYPRPSSLAHDHVSSGGNVGTKVLEELVQQLARTMVDDVRNADFLDEVCLSGCLPACLPVCRSACLSAPR